MKAEIIALGETHHGRHVEAIQNFLDKAPQFDGVFDEEAQDYQASIRSYLETGKLDGELDSLYDRAAAQGNPVREGSIVILNYAREHNLPVVCIDSSKVQTEKYDKKSLYGYWFIAGESRNEDMFETIKEHLKEGERWLLVGGYQHLKLGLHFRSGDKTLGERLKEYIGDGYKLTVLE